MFRNDEVQQSPAALSSFAYNLPKSQVAAMASAWCPIAASALGEPRAAVALRAKPPPPRSTPRR
jgi:hypothetical protein